MHNKTAYIVGASSFCPTGFHPGPGDLVIAADGGYAALRRLGIQPHLVVGDLDSLKRRPQQVAVLRFPRQKDATDLDLAIRLALGHGFRHFKLYGVLGGRLDHSLANLNLLAGLASKGCRAKIIAKQVIVHALSRGSLRLPFVAKGRLLSVFSWGSAAQGVSLQGLKYPLNKAQLGPFESLGVSNEGLGQPVSIHINAGTLLILQSRIN